MIVTERILIKNKEFDLVDPGKNNVGDMKEFLEMNMSRNAEDGSIHYCFNELRAEKNIHLLEEGKLFLKKVSDGSISIINKNI